MLENINLPLFSQNTAEMMRVLRILPLQLNFTKQGTAKRLTPKARFFLVTGKKLTYITQKVEVLVKPFTSKFISCSLHLLRSLPSLQLHPRTEFWSCAADRGPFIHLVFLALPLLFFPSEAKLVCGISMRHN